MSNRKKQKRPKSVEMPNGGSRPIGIDTQDIQSIGQIVTKRPAHRPSSWTPEIEEKILDLLRIGYSINQISKQKDWCPDKATIHRRIQSNQEFCDKYIKAKDIGIDFELQSIMDEVYDTTDKQRLEVLKVYLDAKKWHVSKKYPKIYGDRVTQEIVTDNGFVFMPVFGDKKG